MGYSDSLVETEDLVRMERLAPKETLLIYLSNFLGVILDSTDTSKDPIPSQKISIIFHHQGHDW